jgi:hypothetical protein
MKRLVSWAAVFWSVFAVSWLTLAAVTGDAVAGFILGALFVLAVQNLGFFSRAIRDRDPLFWVVEELRGGSDPGDAIQRVHRHPAVCPLCGSEGEFGSICNRPHAPEGDQYRLQTRNSNN